MLVVYQCHVPSSKHHNICRAFIHLSSSSRWQVFSLEPAHTYTAIRILHVELRIALKDDILLLLCPALSIGELEGTVFLYVVFSSKVALMVLLLTVQVYVKVVTPYEWKLGALKHAHFLNNCIFQDYKVLTAQYLFAIGL